MPKYLAVDITGKIVGSTSASTDEGLYRAMHPSTGEEWKMVELKPLDWPRERVTVRNYPPLVVKKLG